MSAVKRFVYRMTVSVWRFLSGAMSGLRSSVHVYLVTVRGYHTLLG